MAPPKLNNSKEVLNYYAGLADEVAEGNAAFENAQNLIAAAFISGIEYEDKEGKKVTAPQASVENIANVNKSIETIYAKGMESLREVNRDGSGRNFMFMFCRTKGFTSEDFIEIGTNPNSRRSKALMERINSFKQEYYDMFTGNDVERLSDFFIDVMDLYQKDLPQMLECDTAEPLAKNWKYLATWTGGGAIQQSLEDTFGGKTPTQNQLAAKLNEKLKKHFDPEMDVPGMLALLQPIHRAATTIHYKIQNPEDLAGAKTKDGFEESMTEAISSVVRPLKLMKLEIEKLQGPGKRKIVISEKLAKAASIGICASSGPSTDLKGPILLNELKYLAGDNTGRLVCNTEHIDDFAFENYGGKTGVSALPPENVIQQFYNDDDVAEQLEDLDAFNDRMEQKRSADKPEERDMTNRELAILMHPRNDALSEEERRQIEVFMNGPQIERSTLRMSKLSDTVRQAITSIAHIDYRMEPGEIISGAGLLQISLRSNFRKVQNAVENDCSTATMDIGFQRKATKMLSNMLSKVAVTVGSSREFKDLDAAFKDVEAMTPEQIRENREKYEEKLRALAVASEKYINAKNADGKPERSTGKGRMRMNLAKNMLTFANETLSGLEKTEEALLNAPKNLILDAESPKLSMSDAVSARINGFFGKNPTGSQDCLDAGIYKKENYAPEKIEYPENLPFSEREIAIIGLAGLMKGENLHGMTVHNSILSENENGLRLFTHTITDSIVSLRPSPLSEEAVGCFDAARKYGADCINSYQANDPTPLAKLLGQGIKAITNVCLSAATLSPNTIANVAMAQEMMGILKQHPEMIAQSGLKSKDIAAFRSLEKYAQSYQLSREAEKTLKEDKSLTPEDIKQLAAEKLAVNVIQEEINHSHETAGNSATGLAIASELMKKISQANQAKVKAEGIKHEPLTKEELEIKGMAKYAQDLVDAVTFKLDQFIVSKTSSTILSTFTKGENFANQKNAILDKIQELPSFKTMMENPNRTALLLNQSEADSIGKNLASELATTTAQPVAPVPDAPQKAATQRVVKNNDGPALNI